MITNFLAFWILITFAISRGDLFGIMLGALGFLFMHTMIENLHETD